jgi:hypothetical protein
VPIGTLYVCANRCMASNFFSLCETCYNSKEGGVHECNSVEQKFDEYAKPQTFKEVLALKTLHSTVSE